MQRLGPEVAVGDDALAAAVLLVLGDDLLDGAEGRGRDVLAAHECGVHGDDAAFDQAVAVDVEQGVVGAQEQQDTVRSEDEHPGADAGFGRRIHRHAQDRAHRVDGRPPRIGVGGEVGDLDLRRRMGTGELDGHLVDDGDPGAQSGGFVEDRVDGAGEHVRIHGAVDLEEVPGDECRVRGVDRLREPHSRLGSGQRQRHDRFHGYSSAFLDPPPRIRPSVRI